MGACRSAVQVSVLGFDLPTYTAIKGILDAATAYKVELTVQISSTKAAFTEEKQVRVGGRRR